MLNIKDLVQERPTLNEEDLVQEKPTLDKEDLVQERPMLSKLHYTRTINYAKTPL